MKAKSWVAALLTLAIAIGCVGCAGEVVVEENVTTASTTTSATAPTSSGKKFSTLGITTPTGSGGDPVTPPAGGGGSVFTEDIFADKALSPTPSGAITKTVGTLNPLDNAQAVSRGAALAASVDQNRIADFEKNIAYCEKMGGNPDKMVHVSTFTVIGDMVYMTYYANTGSAAEDPKHQEARFAYCPLSNPSQMTIRTVQKVGDEVDGESITMVYDTILMHKDSSEIYVMWTASTPVQYYRFYRVFDVKSGQLGPVRVNRFKAGNVTNDFSISGVKHALYASGVAPKTMTSDIGIMQKLSTRVEGGVTYYYTGAYAGAFNCIIKSRDLITWEYVSTPDFTNQSEFENAVYVVGDRVYYFVRQTSGCAQGFLTYYDLKAKTWATPLLIKDCQSRSDFLYYKNNLYLIHAPRNRSGFGIVRVDTGDLRASRAVAVADMGSSCFYPYVKTVGNEVYISYTVDRKHIRLSKFNLDNYIA